MRILVAEGQPLARKALCEALLLRNFAVYAAEDGLGAIRMIESLLPDAVVTAIALPNCDGFGILEHLLRESVPCYPFMVVATSMGGAVRQRAMELGADAAIAKPIDLDALEQTLRTMGKGAPSRIALRHAKQRHEIACQQLREIGMPESLKGFDYLAKAVALVSVDARALRQATAFLYPHIAVEALTTDHSVERAIRHAIESTWTRGSVHALHRIFGNSIDPQRGKPMNTECIAMLAEQLREKLQKEG